MDLECTRNQISFYIAKDLAPAEKLGFFFGCQMAAIWLPIGCHLVNKATKNKIAKTATSRVNTDF